MDKQGKSLEFTFLLSLSSTSKKKHCEYCEKQMEKMKYKRDNRI